MKDIYIKLTCLFFGHNWRLAVLSKINQKWKLVNVCSRCGEIQ